MSQRAAKLKYLKAKAQKSAPLQSKPSKPILPPIQADDTESDTDGSSTGDLNSQSEEESRGDGEDTEEGADEDDDGVDDEGMERLMNAFGDDGLDDFALAQLAGEVESERDDGETGSEGSGSGKEEDNASEAGSEEVGRGGSEDEEDETGEARDEQSNHKPKPKANPVSHRSTSQGLCSPTGHGRMHYYEFARRSNWTHHSLGPRPWSLYTRSRCSR